MGGVWPALARAALALEEGEALVALAAELEAEAEAEVVGTAEAGAGGCSAAYPTRPTMDAARTVPHTVARISMSR